jgi:CRP-like cAMP-binding protein
LATVEPKQIDAVLEALLDAPPALVDELWLAAGGSGIRTKKGQRIYDEEDPADAVYLLLEGSAVGLSVRDDNPVSEQATILLTAPALLGDREMIAGIPLQETVGCLSNCRILCWSREAFLERWAGSAMKMLLAKDLAARFASAMQLATIQRLKVPRKVHLVLDALQGANRPIVEPTPELLATIVGANRKTVQRALRTLERQGSLERGGRVARPPTEKLRLPLFHSLRCDRSEE